jgi:hypothetical protein
LHDPDQQTQQLIDQCLNSPHTCLPLCEAVSGFKSALILHCEIHPQTDPAYTQVHVGVEWHPGCPG